MPTGYTYKVIEGQKFEDFVLSCARAFCVHMKESDADSLEDPKEETYYQNKYNEAVSKVPYNSSNDFMNDYLTYCINTERSRAKDKDKEESEIAIKRLQNIRDRVARWHPPSVKHENLKIFMLDQLDGTLDQYLPRVEIPLMTYDEYKVWRKESDISSLEYYREQAEKEINRNLENAWWVKTLRDSLK